MLTVIVLAVVLALGAAGVAYARRVSTGQGRGRVADAEARLLTMGAASPDELRAARLEYVPPPVPSPAGRHRRDSPVVDDPLTMTGFMAQLDAATVAAHARMQAAIAAETGELPLETGTPTR